MGLGGRVGLRRRGVPKEGSFECLEIANELVDGLVFAVEDGVGERGGIEAAFGAGLGGSLTLVDCEQGR